MNATIRDATVDDLDAIRAIYNHYVLHSTCTFAEQPETVKERLEWWREHGAAYPVLVAEDAGAVIGWVSLSRYKARCAYRFTVEDSIYLHPDACGRGLGRLLLAAVLERGKSLGYRSVLGGVASGQPASLRLHESLGFERVAYLKQVGFKFGQWIDVTYLQKML